MATIKKVGKKAIETGNETAPATLLTGVTPDNSDEERVEEANIASLVMNLQYDGTDTGPYSHKYEHDRERRVRGYNHRTQDNPTIGHILGVDSDCDDDLREGNGTVSFVVDNSIASVQSLTAYEVTGEKSKFETNDSSKISGFESVETFDLASKFEPIGETTDGWFEGIDNE